MSVKHERPLRILASPANQGVNGNPYITQLYGHVATNANVVIDEFSRRRLLDRYDVVHVHWPEHLVRWERIDLALADVLKVLLLLRVARARGAKLVWTGHDLGPHDKATLGLFALFISLFARQVDLLVSLDHSSIPLLKEKFRPLRHVAVKVVRHGHYRDAYGMVARASARSKLGIDEGVTVLATAGMLRRYKNIPRLVRTFVSLDEPDCLLFVAGQAVGDPAYIGEIQSLVGCNSAVDVRLGAVSVEDMALLHAVADVIILPYSLGTSLHSGAAIMGVSMNRPVVVPNTRAMRELRDLVGSEWVYVFDGDIESALRIAFRAAGEAREESANLISLEWNRIGRETIEAYRSIVV